MSDALQTAWPPTSVPSQVDLTGVRTSSIDDSPSVQQRVRDTMLGRWTSTHQSTKHGIGDHDILHAIDHAMAIGEQDDAKVLYLGPDWAGNLLEVVSVAREDGTELVIHAIAIRARYEPFLRGEGEDDA